MRRAAPLLRRRKESHSAAGQVLATLTSASREKLDLETVLRRRHGKLELNAPMVCQVIDSLTDARTALGFFNWACRQPGFRPNSESCAGLIKVLIKAGRRREAYSLFKEQLRPMCHGHHAYHALLRGFAQAGDLEQLEEIRAEAIKSGVHPCSVSNSLLQGTCDKDVNQGLIFFKQMQRPNVVAYNMIIGSCFKAGKIDEAIQSIDDMGASGCTPSSATYAIIIDGLSKNDRVDEAYQFFRDMEEAGGQCDDPSGFRSLVLGLVKAGKGVEAVKVFHRVLEKGFCPKEATYRGAIAHLCDQGCLEEASAFLLGLLSRGCQPDGLSCSKIVDCALKAGKLEETLGLFEQAARDGRLPRNATYYDVLIDGLCKQDKFDEAGALMQQRIDSGFVDAPSVSYTNVITGFCKLERFTEAVKFFDKFLDGGGRPEDQVCFPLIEGLCKELEVDQAFRVYERMLSGGCTPTQKVCKLLVDALCKAGKMEEARGVFRKQLVIGGELQASNYHGLLAGLFRVGQVDEALGLLDLMVERKCPFTTCTYNIVIDGLCRAGRCSEALEIFNRISGKEADVITYSAVIDGLCRAGQVDEGRKLYKQMSERGCAADPVVHTIMINGLCKAGRIDEAQQLLFSLLDSGQDLVVTAYNALMTGLLEAGRIEEGRSTLQLMVKKGCCPDAVTFAIMIGGLCKANRLDEAYQLLQEVMVEEDVHKTSLLGVFSYNFLIDKFAKVDKLGKALKLFEQMQERGCRPNVVTYNIVLRSLCNAGRMEEVQMCFQKMVASGLDPDNITYSTIRRAFQNRYKQLKELKNNKALARIQALTEELERKSSLLEQAEAKLVFLIRQTEQSTIEH